jgi:prepilin-type N-terminal cleavage/methylation domain-containing protein
MNKQGFTLIELMIVVAIIGILAGVSVPKMRNLIWAAQEANTKGNLGALRSALSIYYGENEGHFPRQLSALTEHGRYISSIPAAYIPPED